MSDEWTRRSAQDYHEAYASGRVSPRDVAERTLAAIAASDEGVELGAFVELHRDAILSAADASTERWTRAEPLGPLDGVPIPIKDEFDVVGYQTRAGTSFRQHVASSDSTVVARLRLAGAVIFGKTSMTEIGLGGTGINPGSRTPRNPYDMRRFTGGSSSGSAAAVSAGIAPIAIGSDAGGSIRMPAALCGVYGLKPTFGRVPTGGAALLAWSLDHVGPLGASVEDLIATFQAIAGPEPGERATLFTRPPGDCPRQESLEGVRFAWCPEFADDADPPVRRAFHDALDRLQDIGAQIEEVSMRWVRWVQRVGYLTIAAEAAASQRDALREHRSEYNLDTRLLLAVAERFTAVEYLHAQRVRSLIRDEFEDVVHRYDAFLSPTLACVAQPISDVALNEGAVDTAINDRITRYTFAGTLTGLPGLSIPCGTSPEGLPIGLHFMGRAGADEELLCLACAADRVMPPMQRPSAAVEIDLGGE